MVQSDRTSWQGIWSQVVWFFVLSLLMWVGLYAADQHLTYVHAGSDLISDQKRNTLSGRQVLRADAPLRVVALGNSRMLSSFRPDVFDAQYQGRASSFNFGIPGDSRIFPILDRILEGGNRPTHVLLQVAWKGDSDVQASPWLLKDDKRILNALLPFRKLPRDLALFAFQARAGGFQQQWDKVRQEVEGVERNRGWYFISAQSHHADHRLPADFRLPSDRPNDIDPRPMDLAAAEYVHLKELAAKYQFRILLIPHAVRMGEFREDPTNDVRVISPTPHIAVVGPHYWLMPPASFSDPVHTNIPGSEEYTRRLAQLLQASGEVR